jgi:ribonuclease HI
MRRQLKTITIYTDGACSGNPGPGGWAAVMRYGEHRKELCGYMPETTNNRMEVFAAIQALDQLNQPCEVTLHSDSAYLVNAIERGWLENWQRNGWKNAAKQPVENQDLWRLLLTVMAKHTVRFVKVRGHADNEHNNRCDALATDQIKQHAPARKTARIEGGGARRPPVFEAGENP